MPIKGDSVSMSRVQPVIMTKNLHLFLNTVKILQASRKTIGLSKFLSKLAVDHFSAVHGKKGSTT